MSEILSDLTYTNSHEWVRNDGDGKATIGVTHHAQDLLGDLVYVELPEIDAVLHAGEEAGVVESVKAASDVYTPLSGTITETNTKLENAPELVNSDPYGEGWLYRIEISDKNELSSLMNADEYRHRIEAEEE